MTQWMSSPFEGNQGTLTPMHDDYGREPSWPVAVVVGALAFVVGVIVRVRNCVGRLFGTRDKRRSGDDDNDD
jgi:hypothetical protein